MAGHCSALLGSCGTMRLQQSNTLPVQCSIVPQRSLQPESRALKPCTNLQLRQSKLLGGCISLSLLRSRSALHS
jgi:hypothetical protein